MEILHEHYPLTETVSQIVNMALAGEATRFFARLANYNPHAADQVWRSLSEKIKDIEDITTFAESLSDIPSAFVQEHRKSFQGLARKIGDILNNSRDITALAYCTCAFFECEYPLRTKLTIEFPENSWVVDFVNTVYAKLDDAWLFEAIKGSDRPDVIGIISFYYPHFRESKVCDFEHIVEDKCNTLLENFPSSSDVGDLEFFFEGIMHLNDTLAKNVAHRLREVIVRILNTEKDYFYIRDFVCDTIAGIDRNLAISTLKSLDLEHLESCIEAASTPPDDEFVKPIGKFDPHLEKKLLHQLEKIEAFYLKESEEFWSEWETDHKPEVLLDLPGKEAARKISSFETTREISCAIEAIYWKGKKRWKKIVEELDLGRIAEIIDIVAFPEDCEKILYYIWRADRERGRKLAEKCGVSNLDLLIAKVDFDLKKSKQKA